MRCAVPTVKRKKIVKIETLWGGNLRRSFMDGSLTNRKVRRVFLDCPFETSLPTLALCNLYLLISRHRLLSTSWIHHLAESPIMEFREADQVEINSTSVKLVG